MVSLLTVAEVLVVGAGYVGLTTSVCLSHLGHNVVCVDTNANRIALLRQGKVPIFEPGVDGLLTSGLRSGRLSFGTWDEISVDDPVFAFLCVQTPTGDTGRADLSYVRAAAERLAPLLPSGSTVVNKSTLPVGSVRVVQDIINRPDINVVSNPEFLREGSAVEDFLRPDRIVVGCDDVDVAAKVLRLYGELTSTTIVTDPESAELIKYASNSYLAMRLTFVNSLAVLCEHVGANVTEVVRGLGSDRRIGSHFLRPGPGWGGSCFPKDTRELAECARGAGAPMAILDAAIRENDSHISRVAARALDLLAERTRHVAQWGLAFKAGTDDTRESPAIAVANQIVDRGRSVFAYDPAVSFAPSSLDPRVQLGESALAVTVGAGLLIVATEWPEFARIEPHVIADRMASRIVVDTRSVLDHRAWEKAGFIVKALGR